MERPLSLQYLNDVNPGAEESEIPTRGPPASTSTADPPARVTGDPPASAPGGKRTRSKAGCLVCRSRRVKCDNGRPTCERCLKYGSQCIFPETKRFDPLAVSSALASRHKDRAGVQSLAYSPVQLQKLVSPSTSSFRSIPPQIPPSLSQASFESSGKGGRSRHEPYRMATGQIASRHNEDDDTGNLPPLFTIEELMTFFRQTQMGSYYRQPIEPPEFLRPVFPDPDELRCFHHCVTYSFSICVTREEFNPWVQHIAPLFLFPDGRSPICAEAIRLAMLSTGAAHLSYLEHRDPTSSSNGDTWRILSDMYRAYTVQLLRQAIKVEEEFLSDSFLAATSMLLLADVLSARMEWREIHRMTRNSVIRRGGFAAMLFGRDRMISEVPSSLRKYLVEQIAFLELMAAHVCREVPLLMLGDLGWFDRLGELAVDDSMAESIEATFGVHRTIFHLATSTAIYLGRAARDRTNEYHLLSPSSTASRSLPPQTSESGQKVMGDLQAWRTMALPVLSQKMDPRTYTGSMAYWHACMILLLRDLDGLERGDEAVQECAREVVRLGREAGDKVEFMMWPMMVASSVLLDDRLRSDARDLYKTFQYQCCFEAEGTLRVVEEVWKRVDEGRDEEACGWSEVMLEMGMPLLLG